MAPCIIMGCVRAIKWTPVFFISAVVIWSYYAYVIQMCIFTVPGIAEKIFYLLLYHPLFVMFVWSYWRTIFTDVAGVPKQFFLSKTDIEKFEREENESNQRDALARIAYDLPTQTRTISGAIRYCEKCKCIKPDRCHHCSVCGKCVLKMDHHCPWVNNCVNFANYKFFVLFLGYAFLYCSFVASTSCQYFVHFWTEGLGQDFGKFHILFLFFASIMFAISLISLLGYHLYLTGLNRSTLESFRAPIFRSGPDKHGFNLGRRANYQEVFGDQRSRWLLPVFSSLGDGVTYPTRTDDIDSDSLLGQRQRWAEEQDDQEEDGYGATNSVSFTNDVALTVVRSER